MAYAPENKFYINGIRGVREVAARSSFFTIAPGLLAAAAADRRSCQNVRFQSLHRRYRPNSGEQFKYPLPVMTAAAPNPELAWYR
jgi:hypothetical protein